MAGSSRRRANTYRVDFLRPGEQVRSLLGLPFDIVSGRECKGNELSLPVWDGPLVRLWDLDLSNFRLQEHSQVLVSRIHAVE